MNRKVFYKPPPLPQSSQSKNRKPRPEWNAEVSDPAKYRLSQAEMIEKKASLQSKNIHQAREGLAERRRKLEEGIVDEETRKIYETALTSKRIDPNPSIRRNLSQMISYERDMLTESRRSTSKRKSVEGPTIEEQLKNTQEFIRRMERASKAKDVIRAVEILEDKPKTSLRGSKVTEGSNPPPKEKQLTPLESISKTLEFMESKLFKNRLEQPKSPNITVDPPAAQQRVTSSQTLQSLGSPILERQQQRVTSPMCMEISHIRGPLRHSPAKEQQEQIGWLSTIQRMNQFIEHKELDIGIRPHTRAMFEEHDISASKYEYNERTSRSERFVTMEQQPHSSCSNLYISPSPMQNENMNTLNLQTEQEVEFSLTIDGDNSFRLDTDQFFQPTKQQQPKSDNFIKPSPKMVVTNEKHANAGWVAAVPRSLVQELDPEEEERVHDVTPSEMSFQEVKFSNDMVKSIQNRKPQPQPSTSKKNTEVQRIKQLLEDTKRNLDKVPVAQMQVPLTYTAPQGISLKRLVR